MVNLIIRCSLVLALLAASPTTFGQGKKANQAARPKIGEQVKVEWAGKEHVAEVVGYSGTGWVKVKFTRNGVEMTPTLPPHQLRPVETVKQPATAAAAPSRTWTDTAGKYKTEGAFVALSDGVVELKKADGSVVTVPLDKLSPADQEMAKKLASATAARPDPEDPFTTRPAVAEATEVSPAKETGSHTDTKNPAGLKITAADWSGASEVLLDDSVQEGGLTPDPEPTPAGPLANRAIPLLRGGLVNHGPGGGAFVSPKAYALTPSNSRAAVALVDEHPGTERATQLAICDLKAGKLIASSKIAGNSVPLDADPTGQLLIARSDNFHIGTHGRADIFDISGTEPKHVISWLPYGDRQWAQRDVHAASLIDKDHAYTVDHAGKLTVWQVNGATALYSLDTWQSATPAVSGTGKYLAVLTKSGIYVLDSATGNPLARFTAQPGYFPRLSFRPDGKQLACASSGLIQVWDVASGKMLHEVYLPTQAAATSVAWPADGYLLLNGSSLVDLARRILLWHYKGGSEIGKVVGDRYLYVAKGTDNSRTLVHTLLPHGEAKKLASSLETERLLAIKPGTSIAVRVEVAMSAEDQQKVRETLTQQLTDNGLRVSDGAPVVLHATTEEGKTESVEYRTIGRGFGTQSATVTKQIQKLTIKEDDKTLWEVTQVKNAPMFLHTKGKDLNTAIAEQMKPDVRFFAGVKLPKHLARPGPKTAGAHGESTLTAQGVQ